MKRNCLSYLLLLLIATTGAAQDSWTRKADLPSSSSSTSIAFAVKDKGYVSGGVGTQALWEFDPATNIWTQKANLPSTRQDGTAMVIGDKAYASMGSADTTDPNNLGGMAWWEYNPATNAWTQKNDFPGIYHIDVVTFTIGARGYLGTGTNFASDDTRGFWEYNPATDTWTPKAILPAAGHWSAAGFSIGNKGYLGTGFIDDRLLGSLKVKDFYEYDPATDVWTRKSDFPGGARSEATAFSVGGKGYLGLGREDSLPFAQSNDFWEYDPLTDHWSRIADFAGGARQGARSFVVGGGGYAGFGSGINGQANDLWQLTRDTTPPMLVVPPAQTLCFNDSDLYKIPPLTATDVSGIASISYVITGATTRTGTGGDASGSFAPGKSLITWTVADPAGNSATGQTAVQVDRRLTVKIPDVYPLLFLGQANTLYEGLGPNCATLFAAASGGTPLPGHSYNYAWSNGSTEPFTHLCPRSAGQFTDTVTVTDALGCQASASKTITVIDVRCGHDGRHVAICVTDKKKHKNRCLPPQEALFALLLGAHPGSCPMAIASTDAMDKQMGGGMEEIPDGGEKGMTLYPNPNKGNFMLQFNNVDASELRVFDQSGKLVAGQVITATDKMRVLPVNLGKLPGGIYTVQAIGREGVYTAKMIVQK